MKQYKAAVLDLMNRIVNADESIPASIAYLYDATEQEAEEALASMLDENYDVVLDYFYSLLPSNQVMIQTAQNLNNTVNG